MRIPCTAKRLNLPILGNLVLNIHGETDAEPEAPKLWPPDMKNKLITGVPDAGKDRRLEKGGMTEDEIFG